MDKEPSLASIWIWAALFSILGYYLCRWRICLVFIVFPLAILLPLAVILELVDPHLGPAIVQEAGTSYSVQVYFAVTMVVVFHLIGILGRIRQVRSQPAESND